MQVQNIIIILMHCIIYVCMQIFFCEIGLILKTHKTGIFDTQVFQTQFRREILRPLVLYVDTQMLAMSKGSLGPHITIFNTHCYAQTKLTTHLYIL